VSGIRAHSVRITHKTTVIRHAGDDEEGI
jgi:hypothetical protein